MKKLINIPEEDFKKLKELAKKNIRSVNAEILIAIKERLK